MVSSNECYKVGIFNNNPPTGITQTSLILVGLKKRNMGLAHVLIIGNISFWPVVNKSDRYLVMVAVCT